MLQLKKETESRGQRFFVAFHPKGDVDLAVPELLRAAEIATLDMRPLFAGANTPARPFYFRRDQHWNEEGNKIAAAALFQGLAAALGIEPRDDAFIRRGLGEWYSSFDRTPIDDRWLDPVDPDASRTAAIRSRYLPLENGGAADPPHDDARSR